MEFLLHDTNALPWAAGKILEFAGENRVFLFHGDMGAGKTTLIKAICEKLKVEDFVSSPTFSIVNEYCTANGSVFHFDFYRIKTESEAFDLGYEDYVYSGNYCFIEWPEKILNLLPPNFVRVRITERSAQERIINLHLIKGTY